MMYMVRKQLYITPDQEADLKRKAEEAGVSEAELVRRALDAALRGREPTRWRPGREAAITRLKNQWASPDTSLEESFDRDAIYEGRMDRLVHDPS